MSPEDKALIDGMSTEQLLRRYRFSQIGDPIFQGDTGEYYMQVLFAKRAKDPEAWPKISKAVGWGSDNGPDYATEIGTSRRDDA